MGAVITAVLTATIATAWSQPTPDEVLDGWATYYGPGVMEQVAINRGMIHDPGGYRAWLAAQDLAGAVALNRAGDLMRIVWLEGPQGIEGPFQAIDCARFEHYLGRQDSLRIVEIDYDTAERWRMAGIGPVEVRVFFRDPALDVGEAPAGRDRSVLHLRSF